MPRRRTARHNPGQTDLAAALGLDLPVVAGGASQVQESVAVAPASPSPFAEFIPVYTLKLVRSGSIAQKGSLCLSSPRDAVNLLYKYFEGIDREMVACILLDNKNKMLGISTISIGDLCSSIVHPREVYKLALLANAASIMLVHNHPSGDPSPSPEDIALTRRLGEAGDLLGIELLDHIILGDPGRWFSLREKGYVFSRSSGGNHAAECQP